MKPRKLNNLYLLAAFLVFSCSSAEVKYTDPVSILNDDYWIDNDTLQIQVEASEEENIPYVMRRNNTCQKAKDNIGSVLLKKHPEMEGQKYKVKVYKTLFTEKNNCRLVVHIHMKNLKGIIK